MTVHTACTDITSLLKTDQEDAWLTVEGITGSQILRAPLDNLKTWRFEFFELMEPFCCCRKPPDSKPLNRFHQARRISLKPKDRKQALSVEPGIRLHLPPKEAG